MGRLTDRDSRGNGVCGASCRCPLEGCSERYSRYKINDKLAAYEDAAPLEKVQEWAKAFEEGGAVVLPCKIGDTLWRVVSSLSNRGKTYWYLQPVKLKPHNLYKIVFGEEVGKTVFRTREEAQAALDGREGQG